MSVNSRRKLLGEPLVHFVVLGLALFFGGEIHRRAADPYRIVITPLREALLAKRYELQFGVAPDAEQMGQLVERDIHEEILFRQGLVLGLDKDDEIVRRRVVQKMQFLLDDRHAPEEPTEVQLASYYKEHVARYGQPARVTFSHIFFSAEKGPAPDRAREALDKLSTGGADPASLGDPFPDLYHFAAYEPEQVYRLFGHTQFADAAFTVPVHRWVGPYESSYGWHLIRVDDRQASVRQTLADVRERVRTDYLLDRQKSANVASFDEVAREFTVVHERS
jgi:hypothetical protein